MRRQSSRDVEKANVTGLDAADLFCAAKRCLDAREADDKLAATRATASAWRKGSLAASCEDPPVAIERPGLPAALRLVAPADVPKRRLRTERGLIAFVHAVAHIEFNAINLAWDCVYRFRDLPRAYYDDWVRVAEEEASHFALLRGRLRELGADYGDCPAHGGLWEMAARTAHDLPARMAMVPRYLEARGLDVTPAMIERLQRAGDSRTVAVLEVILEQEVAHVAAGSRWFRHACEQRALDPQTTFIALVERYLKGRVLGPFNEEHRRRAGFSDGELAALAELAARG
jgi:uncharacterized ferritin-like protein (DUF455 family)